MASWDRRQLWKQTLSLARVKLLYTRIVLTRFTTFYFFFALVTCIILSSLQAVAFTYNSKAISVVAAVLKGNTEDGLAIVNNGKLQVCTSIPNQPGTNCTVMLTFGAGLTTRNVADEIFTYIRDDGEDDFDDDDIENSLTLGPGANLSLSFEATCIPSLRWLDDVLHDAQREDVVTLLFQIWLFILAVVAILNESIPHLVAALLGHVLGAGWAAYRVESTNKLMKIYRTGIVPEACGGVDYLGNWWETKIQHAIPIVVVNGVTLIALSYLSLKLFKVYATQTFSRVGASSKTHRIYKLVLVFSVCLQLSGFFSLASTALWIDKICHGMIVQLAKHSSLYLGAFIAILVLQPPWLLFGWICVRKECKIRFGIFCAIALFLLTIPTVMFSSPLYRYIFITWPFFATMTVTAYVLTIVTTILGIICRLNFDKGLAHYLQVTDALEGVDFTPVYFPKEYETDPEKVTPVDHKPSGKTRDSHLTTFLKLPITSFHNLRKTRGSSIYSDRNTNPILLSSSPPLISELGPVPAPSVRSRLSKPPPSRSASMRSVKTTASRAEQEQEKKSVPNVPTIRPAPRIQTVPGRARESDATSTIRSSPTQPSPPYALSASPTPSYSSANSNPFVPRTQKQGLPANPRPGAGQRF